MYIIFIISFFISSGFKTVHYKSKDGIQITADLYMSHKTSAPFIVLFHQARWSRGEYREIAPKLNKMGFNCLAVDQRSGDAVNGVENETKKSADRKSTRLNTSHVAISYDDFCLKKKSHDINNLGSTWVKTVKHIMYLKNELGV